MTSDANAKLPIPTYDIRIDGNATYEAEQAHEEFPGVFCKADDVRGLVERMEKNEAQVDRLAEVLRTAVELSHSYDSDNVACWDMVWASAEDAIADIEKENA